MTDGVFDIDRLRRNWLPEVPEAPPTHPRLAHVGVAEDPLNQLEKRLDRVRRLMRLRFPQYRDAWDPFVEEADVLTQRLVGRANGVNGQLGQTPDELDDDDVLSIDEDVSGDASLRLGQVLDQIEDLLEVFLVAERAGV